MAAITDLASASSVAAGDYLVVSQSGTDKKVTADKFAVVGNASTFAAAQTFSDEINVRQHSSNNAWSIDIANGTTVTLTNGTAYSLSTSSVFSGLIIVANATDGQAAMFMLSGGVVVEIADGGGVYSTTKNTASSSNVHYETSQYWLQNYTGGSRTYSVFSLRLRAGS